MLALRVLGTVEVADGGGGWRRAGTTKQCCVLAALAMSPNTPVSVVELITRVWGDAAPVSAPNVLYGHVSRLRSLLAASGVDAALVRAGDGGYRLDVAPDHIDVVAMRSLASRARGQQSADPDAAVQSWRRAAGLWRGAALSGLDGPWAEQTRTTLHHERLGVLTGRFGAELAVGRHTDVVTELHQAVSADPAAESLVWQLMLALYRCDRSAEALSRFEETRRLLRDELGVDPSQRLRDLHRRILRQDPDLDWRPAAPPAESGTGEPGIIERPVQPAQLPADTKVFTGRGAQLDELIGYAQSAHDSPWPGAVAVTAVDGMAGVGKTALAVHAGHRLASRFPDGQLFVDLHGFTADVAPVAPAEALDRMLRALGLPADHIPSNVDDRAAALRSALAERRMLILLDNAANAEQVRPLLPASSGSFVIITSRNQLTDLDDAHAISLDAMPASDAVELFRRGAGLSAIDPATAEVIGDIVERCGHLPLAVRILASRLRSRPQWSPQVLRDRLDSSAQPLSVLRSGSRSVATAFRLSYQELNAEHRRAFRLLGLAPGRDFDVHAAAALLGMPPSATDSILDQLVDANLLQAAESRRYRFHDLLRQYAVDIAGAEDASQDRRAALLRMLNMYCAAAKQAVEHSDSLFVWPRGVTIPPVAAPVIDDRLAAKEWWGREWRNLGSAIEQAVMWHLDRPAYQLAMPLWNYLHGHGYHRQWLPINDRALQAARRDRNKLVEAVLLKQRGGTLAVMSRYAEAIEHLERSLELARDGGDLAGQAGAMNNLGSLYQLIGRLHRALEAYGDGIVLAERIRADRVAMLLLGNCAEVHLKLGNVTGAESLLDRQWRLADQMDNDLHRASVRFRRGTACRLSGDLTSALRLHRESLEFGIESGLSEVRMDALNAIGCDYRLLGRLDDAVDHHRQALQVSREGQHEYGRCDILVELGRTYERAARLDEAVRCFEQAATLSADIDNAYDLARAHHGIADVLAARDRSAEARRHWESALRRYITCGVPQAEELRRKLSAA